MLPTEGVLHRLTQVERTLTTITNARAQVPEMRELGRLAIHIVQRMRELEQGRP